MHGFLPNNRDELIQRCKDKVARRLRRGGHDARTFQQGFDDQRGLGLGLSIARRSIQADGGRSTVRDLPGKGGVFTIALPVRTLA